MRYECELILSLEGVFKYEYAETENACHPQDRAVCVCVLFPLASDFFGINSEEFNYSNKIKEKKRSRRRICSSNDEEGEEEEE